MGRSKWINLVPCVHTCPIGYNTNLEIKIHFIWIYKIFSNLEFQTKKNGSEITSKLIISLQYGALDFDRNSNILWPRSFFALFLLSFFRSFFQNQVQLSLIFSCKAFFNFFFCVISFGKQNIIRYEMSGGCRRCCWC